VIVNPQLHFHSGGAPASKEAKIKSGDFVKET